MERSLYPVTPPALTTRPSVRMRYTTTQQATSTRPTVLMRSLTTPRATSTRPSARVRSLATPPAATTRPSVLVRSLTIPAAAAISPWALMPVLTLSLPVTLLLSVIPVRTRTTVALSARPTPTFSRRLGPILIWSPLTAVEDSDGRTYLHAAINMTSSQ